jgi:ribosomal protein S18 acetylase RimI-like enzyme
MPQPIKQIEMSVDEFLSMREEFGWKHEYFDGKAWIQPWEWHVHVEVEVPPEPASVPATIRPLRPEDAESLVDLFRATFEASVEFCGYSDEQFHEFARQRVEGVLAGKSGDLDSASRIAVERADASLVIGAALVRRSETAPVLEILFVRPNRQRRGLGKDLLGTVFAELRARGDTLLRSSYHVCNTGSAAWHERMGFLELDDLFLAERRSRYWQREARRRDETGDVDGAADARREQAVWAAKVEELEARRDREGWDAVLPYRLF